jgi:hypothetical protein
MPYTHFRMIAYEVPTASFDSRVPKPSVLSGWLPGKKCDEVARLPVSADVTNLDARVRLLRLAAVVDRAEKWLRTCLSDDGNTLKIFMVPEFYFRPARDPAQWHLASTYPTRDCAQILGCLRDMFKDAAFNDWLFVCGTVMWNTNDDSTQHLMFFNTAVVARGGKNAEMWTIEKALPSKIDGLPLAIWNDPNGLYRAPGYDSHLKQFMEGEKNRRRRLFRSDGIRFGLEVCLDHAPVPTSMVLKQTLLKFGGHQPQLHLLTAGGMRIRPESVAARVNGFILRNDGLAQRVDDPSCSTLQRVTGYSKYFRFPNSEAMLGPPIKNEGGLMLTDNLAVPMEAGFTTPRQQVSFYPTQLVPV